MRDTRRRRILELRQTVIAMTLCAFIIAFSTIYIQMASGNDPALGTNTPTQVATSSVESATDDETVVSTEDSFAPAPVTSGQS